MKKTVLSPQRSANFGFGIWGMGFGGVPAHSIQPSAEFTLLRDKISANSEEAERSGRESVHTEGVCSGGKQVMFEPMSFRWVSSPCLTHLNMHPVGHVLVDEEIDDIFKLLSSQEQR